LTGSTPTGARLELLVLNGIVLCLEGREIETTWLKAIHDRHERWLGELGRRIAELEGATKGEHGAPNEPGCAV
jgi:hypothetical protein